MKKKIEKTLTKMNLGKGNAADKDALEITAISIRIGDDDASGLSVRDLASRNRKNLGHRSSGGHNRNISLNNKILYHETTDQATYQSQPKEETRKKYIQENVIKRGFESRKNTSNQMFIKEFTNSQT